MPRSHIFRRSRVKSEGMPDCRMSRQGSVILSILSLSDHILVELGRSRSSANYTYEVGLVEPRDTNQHLRISRRPQSVTRLGKEDRISNWSRRTKRTNAFVDLAPTVQCADSLSCLFRTLDVLCSSLALEKKCLASLVRTVPKVPFDEEVRYVAGHHQINAVCLSCRSCFVLNYHWRRGIRRRVALIGVHTSRLRATGPKYRTSYEQYKASYDKLSETVKRNAQT